MVPMYIGKEVVPINSPFERENSVIPYELKENRDVSFKKLKKVVPNVTNDSKMIAIARYMVCTRCIIVVFFKQR